MLQALVPQVTAHIYLRSTHALPSSQSLCKSQAQIPVPESASGTRTKTVGLYIYGPEELGISRSFPWCRRWLVQASLVSLVLSEHCLAAEADQHGREQITSLGSALPVDPEVNIQKMRSSSDASTRHVLHI